MEAGIASFSRFRFRQFLQGKVFSVFLHQQKGTILVSAPQETVPIHFRFLEKLGQEKPHKLLTRKLFEKAVNPGTTSCWLTRKKYLCSWVRRRTHKLFCPVNWPVVPGSAGPSPDQKVYVYVFFCGS